MAIKYKICPKCNSKNVAKIIYGYPTYELESLASAGKVRLGGCCVFVDAAEYACNDCSFEWNKKEAVEFAYRKIKTIKAYVGGVFGPSYNVEIDLENGEVHWNQEPLEYELPNLYNRKIMEKTKDRIIENLKVINLLNWKRKYIEQHVLDGTQWSVDIIREGKSIHKYGSNAYPDEWGAFCRLIRNVTKRPFS